jgi:NAD(P)-dependent dehydrogenase (short-subunit alcohol dehydrogenase family)
MPDSKLIVVTGATRGLGRAMVERFVELGHRVLGCGRGEAGIAALRTRFNEKHDFASLDVSRDDQVRAWAARVLAKFGAPDLLLNNAAVVNRNRPLWQIPADEFQKVIDINIAGVTNCIRHFVPAMIERGSGVVVNFSSGWGRSTSPEVAPYCATKWAIEGLSQALSQELPDGLAAVALNPGIINTDMLQSCFGVGAARYPSPEEWSRRSVPFLLKLGPRHNGQSVDVE